MKIELTKAEAADGRKVCDVSKVYRDDSEWVASSRATHREHENRNAAVAQLLYSII